MNWVFFISFFLLIAALAFAILDLISRELIT